MNMKSISGLLVVLALTGIPGAMAATAEPAQMNGLGFWATTTVFTIGETLNGYTPPGIPDGMGAFEMDDQVVVFGNHELRNTQGYPYELANGAVLSGARISYLTFDRDSRELVDTGLAFDTIYNRAGDAVASPADLDFGALHRLCSAGSFEAGQAGFVDDVFLAGEEAYGGTEFALDVHSGELWALPWLGRAAWESVAALEVPQLNRTHVAILVGDDRSDAPLLLYVGRKTRDGNFVERNGLGYGTLYMWVSDSGDLSPADWNGTGTSRTGRFVEVVHYDPDQAGSAVNPWGFGFDELGFAAQAELDRQRSTLGAFRFSRPEDLHTNPRRGKGNEVVYASTGRNTRINQGADLWGTTYLVDVKISRGRIRTHNITAEITILYDGDDAGKRDFGIRSPDNLVWADDGQIYIQEDRSLGGFGAASGEETSIWQLDPKTGQATRVAQMNRAGVPSGQFDVDPFDVGDWESSGIIDVTDVFDAEGERLLFFNVQAHSLRGGAIGSQNLVEGGQYLFMSKKDEEDDDEDDERD